MTLAGTGNGARLNFQDTQTLSGIGQVIFGGTGANDLITSSGALTIGSGLTIRGGPGRIDTAAFSLTNEGAIIADVAGTTISIRANPFTNNGTIQELNGGKVLINP